MRRHSRAGNDLGSTLPIQKSTCIRAPSGLVTDCTSGSGAKGAVKGDGRSAGSGTSARRPDARIAASGRLELTKVPTFARLSM
ncbi:MAG: hypothetical protein M5U35_10715 [Roseovarius sp.]|nr:hypothetical protein [Roseovarius sp.]